MLDVSGRISPTKSLSLPGSAQRSKTPTAFETLASRRASSPGPLKYGKTKWNCLVLVEGFRLL